MFPTHQQPQQNRAHSAPLGSKCSLQLLHLKLHACLWLGVGAISLIPASPAESRPALPNSPQPTTAKLQLDTANIVAQARYRWPWEREPNKSSQPSTDKASSARLKWPSNLGTPKSSAGTGSRGSCSLPAGALPLTRIGGSQPMHKTVSDRPEIWFYSPYTNADVPTFDFSLHAEDNQGDEELYRQQIELPQEASLVPINLPLEAPALLPDRSYRWYIEIPCEQDDGEISPAVLTGKIHRVEASTELLSNLEPESSDLERAIAYAEAGIWYDAFQYSARFRAADSSKSAQKTWSDFLSDSNVGLSNLAELPLEQTI